MRLNRFLASAGLGSRRSVEEIIQSGRVRINGRVIDDLATQVGPEDSVKVGSRVLQVQQTLHAVLHKPRGFLCTADDERDRRTIFELLPEKWPRVFHVGRLDRDSEGLMLVTNDGDLALRLTHPSFHVEKEYEVGLDKTFEPAHREKLLRGFHIPGGRAKAEQVGEIKPQLIRVVLRQGLKRQIRLMFYELGYEVVHLKRVRIGAIKLGHLRPGEWRLLTPKELTQLRTTPAAPEPAPKAKPSRPRSARH